MAEDPVATLRILAESRSYRAAIDHCYLMLDDADADRGYWTLQIALLYFLNFWERGELFEEAPRFAEQAVKLNPYSAETHFWFGHISEVAFKDTLLARREYESAIEIRPDYAIAHLSLAATNLSPDEQLPLILATLELQPSNFRALMMLSEVLSRLGDDEAAARTLDTLLDRSAYEEHSGGIMDAYINTELNFSYLEERIVKEARKRLEGLRKQQR